MRTKYLALGFLLIIVAPYVFSCGQALEKTGHYVRKYEGGPMEWEPGMSTWGTLIEFLGAFCVWIGVPLIIYGHIAKSQMQRSAEGLKKRKREIVIAITVLLLGVVAFEWSNQLSLELVSFFNIDLDTSFILFWGIVGIVTSIVSLGLILIMSVKENASMIFRHLTNLRTTLIILSISRRILSNLTGRAERCGYGPSRYTLISLELNILLILTAVTLPGLGWFRWVAALLFLWIFGKNGRTIGYQVLLSQVGKNITPVFALLGLVYGYVLIDPLSSAILNSLGVFFLFFSFDVPRLVLNRDDFFERLLFSAICGFVAFGGNIFMGSSLGILESIRSGVSYSSIGNRLLDALGPAILAGLAIIAAELFCDAPLLRARGVDSYTYEKVSGSLFYLSFFFGFGGNRIISPLLFAVALLFVAGEKKAVVDLARGVWSGVTELRKSLVSKFLDTSIDQRLVTEGILGSAVLAILNLRFLGHVQVEPVHLLVILVQSAPILLLLYPKKDFPTIYIISNMSVVLTGLVGIVYLRSWPFCAFMTELSSSLSGMLNSVGVGEVPLATFLSWVAFFYLNITVGTIVSIPIDSIRRRMEKAFRQNRRDDLKKLYHLSLLVMIIGSALLMLCLYPILLEYYPSFTKQEHGQLVYYDLFWAFFLLYSAVFVAKLLFLRYELYRPIDLSLG